VAKHIGGKGALNVLEELAFLAADVGGEEGAELLEQVSGGGIAESGDQGLESAVVGEETIDEGVWGAGWEKDLLFDFEVVD
jgi:hypothetical protein